MAVNGGMTLKPIEVDLPMPEDEVELNAKFSELVVSCEMSLIKKGSSEIAFLLFYSNIKIIVIEPRCFTLPNCRHETRLLIE
jgi:hypothetical protein